MPNDIIREARELCERATPGPWRACNCPAVTEIHDSHTWGKRLSPFARVEPDEWRNGEFIARSRTLIPELLDLLAAKDAEIARLTGTEGAAVALHQDCAAELDRMRKERNAAVAATPHDCDNCKHVCVSGACRLLPDGDEFSPDYTEGFDRDDCEHWEWCGAEDGQQGERQIVHHAAPEPDGSELKADAGKPELSYAPLEMLEPAAMVRKFAATKYGMEGIENWRKLSDERLFNAMLRHIVACQRGEADAESGFPSIFHVAMNANFLAIKELERMKAKEAGRHDHDAEA